MKAIASVLLAVFILLFTACNQNAAIGPEAQRVLGDSYQPVSKSSSWSYNVVYLTSSAKESVVITGNTTAINGKPYYEAITSDGKTPVISYYSHSGTLYTHRSIALDAQDILEEPYVDESRIAGGIYTLKGNDAGTSHGKQVQYVVTTVQKDFPYSVYDVTYQHTIRTHVELQYNDGSGFQTTETHEIFVAKGIGVVEEDVYLNGTLYARHLLTRYNVI